MGYDEIIYLSNMIDKLNLVFYSFIVITLSILFIFTVFISPLLIYIYGYKSFKEQDQNNNGSLWVHIKAIAVTLVSAYFISNITFFLLEKALGFEEKVHYLPLLFPIKS